ncbi:helix-turn-helix domain-containing protein [Microbacterium sp. G2-8]|uniref:helix-turn-helix domain-containing protein n=1 Tax=Microbacterium sp. G2-8 TaxID=2842454 RepID=UPI001C899892|nr:helix-turn-helix domain-containing protein [Microbacterium sp. G2-8]
MWSERASSHDAIRTVWSARVEQAGRYPVAASEHWGLSFVRHVDETVTCELDGPTLAPRILDGVIGEEYWGVEWQSHVFMRNIDKSAVIGETVALPVRDGRVVLDGSAVPVPTADGLEEFVVALLDTGVVVADPDVRRALAGDRTGFSLRAWQRRFRRVTGFSQVQIAQLERARHAYRLLQEGMPCAGAAVRAGYSDQAHLTRAMRVFHGQTPARILAGELPS